MSVMKRSFREANVTPYRSCIKLESSQENVGRDTQPCQQEPGREKELSQTDLWAWLLSKRAKPSEFQESSTRFLRKTCQQKPCQLGLNGSARPNKQRMLEPQNRNGVKQSDKSAQLQTCYVSWEGKSDSENRTKSLEGQVLEPET